MGHLCSYYVLRGENHYIMKSMYERNYEKLIISSIAERECESCERADLFLDFYTNSSEYYEELCDALFRLSSGEKRGTLFMSLSGKPYISDTKANKSDKVLFCDAEIPEFNSDLHEQLTFFADCFAR